MSTISVSLPDSIHDHASRLAQREGYSLNQFIAAAVGEKLASVETEQYLAQRAARGSRVDIDAILEKVPDADPDAEDRL
jgi:hypothetical protein